MARQAAAHGAKIFEFIDGERAKTIVGFERIKAVFTMTGVVDEQKQFVPRPAGFFGLREHNSVNSGHQFRKG